MHRISIALLSTLLVVGCDDKAKEDGKAKTQANNADEPEAKQSPQVDPKPEPDPVPDPPPDPVPEASPVKVAIASVTMVEDCPDPPPPAEPEPEMAEDADKKPTEPAKEEMAAKAAEPAGDMAPGAAAYDGGGMPDFCEQSMMQLTLQGHEGEAAPVKIEAVRLLQPSDKTVVAEIDARGPTVWDGTGTYAPWDESLKAGTEVKASYKLSVPNWSDVERKIGNVPSAGHMFVIEVDISVGGVKQTVTSPEFARREPEVVVT